MLVTTLGLAGIVLGLVIVIVSLRKAPEGYEDARGFHILRKRSRGSAVMRATAQTRLSRSESLRRAEANL